MPHPPYDPRTPASAQADADSVRQRHTDPERQLQILARRIELARRIATPAELMMPYLRAYRDVLAVRDAIQHSANRDN